MSTILQINRILRRRSAYRATFGSPVGLDVLADLKRFCGAQTTSVKLGANGAVDPLAMAIAEGRREVFNRILAHIHLSDAELTRLRETVEQ